MNLALIYEIIEDMPTKSSSLTFILGIDSEYHLPTPEQKLLLAILERAILDATGNLNGAKAHVRRDAENWIEETFIFEPEISFSDICDYCYLSKEKIKTFIKTHKGVKLTTANKSSPNRFILSILDD